MHYIVNSGGCWLLSACNRLQQFCYCCLLFISITLEIVRYSQQTISSVQYSCVCRTWHLCCTSDHGSTPSRERKQLVHSTLH